MSVCGSDTYMNDGIGGVSERKDGDDEQSH